MQGTPSLRLPGEHFAAALLFLFAGAIGLIWIAPELADGLYLSPHVAGITHCFTLGWVSMTIFGALYQLLPVALGVSITSERAGHVSFWTFAPGVAIFASGVASSSSLLRDAGVSLMSIGIIVLVVNVALALRRVVKRDVIWAAITTGLTFLSLTLVAGALLAGNLQQGYLGAWRVRVLTMHLHMALLGWVFVMIIGISHRLLPMFLLAHNTDTKWTRRALAMTATGVPLLAIGLVSPPGLPYAPLSWIGATLIEVGIACFLTQAVLFFRSRKRPKLDAGLRHAATAVGFLLIAAVLAPFVLAGGVADRHFDIVYILVGLLGGISLYVTGQFYKIVPFLAWMARFRDDMGKKPVPMIAQLYSAHVAHTDLALFVSGIAGMAIGVMAREAMIVRVSAFLFTIAVVLFASQMIRVAFGTSFGNAPPAGPPQSRLLIR